MKKYKEKGINYLINKPGGLFLTRRRLRRAGDSRHIIALNSSGEILSSVQDGKIFIATALSSIPFAGPWLAYNIARMPQAAGKRTSLVTDKTLNPVDNHDLKPLWEAMEKKMEDPQINVIAKKL